PKVRKAMCEAARRLILEANYTNAATVEFIVDKKGNYYFIEVNARIQVEHPVSEMVTGIDLIEQQIRVASGEKLAFKQRDIVSQGCSIECRINAEDATRNFMPAAGTIEQIYIPGGLGVRFDTHVHAGYEVPPYYDSMIGKLIVHQPTREKAIATMIRCLEELRIKGIATTTEFQIKVLQHKDFVEGKVDTKWVERTQL
ncbi:MAG: acetyl-CoA carboxylase biotin carboxylase subunit, partial [Pirellulaceae bacterium]